MWRLLPVLLGLLACGCGQCPAECPPCGDLQGQPQRTSVLPDGGLTADARELECACVASERLFPTLLHPVEEESACHLASPLWYEHDGDAFVISAVGDRINAVDPKTGAIKWTTVLPVPDGEQALVVATPLLVDDHLFVGYHTTQPRAGGRDVLVARIRHRLVALDLTTHQIDETFDSLDFAGATTSVDGQEVRFLPAQALMRAAIIGAHVEGARWGRAYVTFGNARDIQPWHGFAFEVDLDRWQSLGTTEAITGFFVDTPEADCGSPGQSGSRLRVCGGGLWAPSGPLVVERGGSYEVTLASGNGQLDLSRRDYANTLMRTGPGLTFDPRCDLSACVGFAPDEPNVDCVESCVDLFIPRMPAGETFSDLVSGDRCLGDSMFECWAKLDYIGGSTPVYVEAHGQALLAYPTKDGAVYLVDYAHFGRLHDRLQLVPVCGTENASCTMDWAGMIVTQPSLTTRDDEPWILIPTFMPDAEQEAGVFALRIVSTSEGLKLEEVWRWPRAETSEARTRFRAHPSRMALTTLPNGDEVGVIVEPSLKANEPGHLLVLGIDDGVLLADVPLAGSGYRFVMPLVVDGKVYVPSCEGNAGPSTLEGYALVSDLR